LPTGREKDKGKGGAKDCQRELWGREGACHLPEKKGLGLKKKSEEKERKLLLGPPRRKKFFREKKKKKGLESLQEEESGLQTKTGGDSSRRWRKEGEAGHGNGGWEHGGKSIGRTKGENQTSPSKGLKKEIFRKNWKGFFEKKRADGRLTPLKRDRTYGERVLLEYSLYERIGKQYD